MTALCSQCRAQNPDTSKFCGQCGTRLVVGCPSCGAPTAPDQKFCNECGNSLTALQPQPAAAAASVAERRVCSVLFADLVSFTPLSESRDPEQVRELLTRYFDIARTVIGRHGGSVEKFIGDAVMAVWGTPIAIEGDAERAVRAALDLVVAVGALGAEIDAPELALRAGVVTGEVAVTLGAVSEGMVAGDAVNTAARVQSAASPGTVWVDGATQRLAGAAIGFEKTGDHLLKGKSAPMTLWRATRVMSGIGGSQRVDGLEAPLTGRDTELRSIKELLHATVERRTPRLVLVSGLAGLGKSRLGWEFEKYIDGLTELVWWHRGRCLSYGDGVAFWALAEIVRQRFGIAEEVTAEVAATMLFDRLPDFVPNAEERDYVGPRLGRLLGLPYGSSADTTLSREELFAGWRMFFQRLSTDGPVVLLIEDAQYADPALLDFIDHLIDWTRSSPVFVLMFARPELEEQHPEWGKGRNRTTLTLDPLDTRSMQSLLLALVPRMPATALATIADQAQGNPLFAVETIRSLIDRDAVVPVEGSYRLVGDVGALSVPDSLQGLLAARLDALGPQLRALVADAAVVGTTFPVDALDAVSAQTADDVRAGLSELVRRGVFEISADELSPQRGAYYFSQNMLRQVAYDTLSRRDRKARHLAVAAYLRAKFAGAGDEVSDVVARHYLDALAAVPEDPDAPDIRGRAVAALIRAAERAGESGAPVRAAETFVEAAELTEAFGTQESAAAAAELWERASAACDMNGTHDKAVRFADRARTLYLQVGRPRDAARAQTRYGRAIGLLGRHSEAQEILSAALAVLSQDPDRDTIVTMLELAGVEIFAGQAQGQHRADEALDLAQGLDVPPLLIAQLLIIQGIGYQFNGRLVQAVAVLEHAARIAERLGDMVVWGRALLNLSGVIMTVDPAEGVRTARIAGDHCRRVGARWNLIIAVINLAFSALATGDWDQADAALTEAMGADNLEKDENVLATAATFAALRGDIAKATEYSALASLRASSDPQELSGVYFADACLAAASGDHAEALTNARKTLGMTHALGLHSERICWAWPLATRSAFLLGDTAVVAELIDELDGHPVGHLPPILRAERTLARARLQAVRGDADAGAALAGAITELRVIASPYHLAHALIDCVEHGGSGPAGVGEDAAYLEEATAIAVRLRVPPLLDRIGTLHSVGSPR